MNIAFFGFLSRHVQRAEVTVHHVEIYFSFVIYKIQKASCRRPDPVDYPGIGSGSLGKKGKTKLASFARKPFGPHPAASSRRSGTTCSTVTQTSQSSVIFRPFGPISHAESIISSRLAREENSASQAPSEACGRATPILALCPATVSRTTANSL